MAKSTPTVFSPVLSRLSNANRAARHSRLKMELKLIEPIGVAFANAVDEDTIMPSIIEEEEEAEGVSVASVDSARNDREVPDLVSPPRRHWLRSDEEHFVPEVFNPPLSPRTGDKRRAPSTLTTAYPSPSSTISAKARRSHPQVFVPTHNSTIDRCEASFNQVDLSSFVPNITLHSTEEHVRERIHPRESTVKFGDLEILLAAARTHRLRGGEGPAPANM